MKKKQVIAVFFVLLVVGMVAGCDKLLTVGHSDETSVRQEGVEVGDRAPIFALMDPGGTRVSLASLRGRPVILNFWTTLCPYCVGEMRNIQSFYSSHSPGIEVLGVNLTSDDQGIPGIRNFLLINHYTFPVVFDVDGKVGDLYLIRNIPTTLFIDARGIIRFKYTGPMTPETLRKGLAETDISEPKD